MSENQTIIKGKSPEDLGGNSFTTMMIPLIREASKQMQAQDLARFYSGIMSATYGSMVGDFGPQGALALLNEVHRILQGAGPMVTPQ